MDVVSQALPDMFKHSCESGLHHTLNPEGQPTVIVEEYLHRLIQFTMAQRPSVVLRYRMEVILVD